MAEITAQMVKALRETTNAGVMDCKKALTEANGVFERAVEILREKGVAAAAKKADREAKEGIIGSYIHPGSKVVGMIEVNCETDFVARTEQFQQLARDLAMQVVATRPEYVSREEVPAEVVETERQSYQRQAGESERPRETWEPMVEEKLEKWYGTVCLMDQPFIKDSGITIGELITQSVISLKENIRVRRFCRLEVGE